MLNIAKRKTLNIWIALLAILFSALAPALSHTLDGAGAAGGEAEICTVSGYKMVKLMVKDGGPAPAPDQHGMQHCTFCSTHGGQHALADTRLPSRTADAGRDVFPPLFYTAPQSLHTWSAANPRGPPSLA